MVIRRTVTGWGKNRDIFDLARIPLVAGWPSWARASTGAGNRGWRPAPGFLENIIEPSRIILGSCLDVLPTLPSASVDCVLTDPPYPCIDRNYGRWTEAEWFEMMHVVVPECMRVLKPTGSAVFILQPNSERVGRMRTWLWEFMVWVGKEWGIVQDAYWWNYAAPPEAHSIQGGLGKPSVKMCVWVGLPTCYRDQREVLMDFGDYTLNQVGKCIARGRVEMPSGHGFDKSRMVKTAMERGGTSPYNLLAFANARGHETAGAHGHGAGTPRKLCEWWLRYICPPRGLVLDPFAGSGTVPLAAWKLDREYIGIEVMPEYVEICEKRLAKAREGVALFEEVG